MRIFKLIAFLLFIGFVVFIIRGDALNENNTIVISNKNSKRWELLMYRSITSFTNPAGITVKKMMYSHLIKSNCRLNWDVLSYPNKTLGTHLRLHFNFILEGCKIAKKEIMIISNLMLKKVFKEWNLQEIGEVEIDLPNFLSTEGDHLILLGQKFKFSQVKKDSVIFHKLGH